MSRAVSPFEQLLAPVAPRRLPLSASCTLVINGRKLDSLWAIRAPKEDADQHDEAEVQRLRREVQRQRDRERYQRDKADPAKMAKRQAYAQANREKIAAWKREYDLRNRERTRPLQAAWAQRERRLHPDLNNERQRRYYARNREKVLEQGRQRRALKKGIALAKHTPIAQWTTARQLWLEEVASNPLNKRSRGQVGFQCFHFGWTEWQRNAAGLHVHHEQLTELGRTTLAAWQASPHPFT
jgi:hypothetical protein